MDYMLLCEDDVHLFKDHRNLLFVFNPYVFKPSLGTHIVNKVQRWALYLSRFMYTIEHIEGSRNATADIFTRWFAGYKGKRPTARRITTKLMSQVIMPSTTDADFIWPTMEHIATVQASTQPPSQATKDEYGIFRLEGRVWIPEPAVDLQIRLIVCAHYGSAGHRGAVATRSSLREH